MFDSRPVRIHRGAVSALVFASCALGACADERALVGPRPQAARFTAAPGGAVPTLTWLAPLGGGTASPGTFDAEAAPVVEICVWAKSACAEPPLARFASGGGSLNL